MIVAMYSIYGATVRFYTILRFERKHTPDMRKQEKPKGTRYTEFGRVPFSTHIAYSPLWESLAI
jgi:hypothetical protein